MKLDEKWGVVQALKIEADTFESLLAGCMVGCVAHAKVSHFKEVSDQDGGNSLHLYWTDHGDASRLPFDLTGPTEVAAFGRQWLEKNAIYPTERPDTDGSTVAGFRIERRSFYDVVVVKPIWIVYGK